MVNFMSFLKKNKILSSFKWMGAYSILNAILTPVTLAILVLFLTPTELGERSIVMVIVGLSATLTQFGIAQAIISREEVLDEELDTLFIFNIIIGCFLCLLMFFIAPLISQFYHNKDLTHLIRLTSIVFVLDPMSVMFSAILEKKFLFKMVATFNIIKVVILNLSTLLFATMGLGSLSYIIGQILSSIILFFLFFIYFLRREQWRPSFSFNISILKSFLSFGLFVSGKEFLNFLGKYFDEIIVGRILNVEILGYYYVAKQLIEKSVTLISSNVNKVFYPLYSELVKKKDGYQSLKSQYLLNSTIVSLVGFPIFGLLIINTDLIIDFLDSDWKKINLVIIIFSCKAMIDIVSSGFASSALYALEKPKEVFKIDLILFPIRISLITIGAFISIEMVAGFYALFVLVKALILQRKLNFFLNISMRRYLKSIMINLYVNLIFTSALFFTIHIVGESIVFNIVLSILYLLGSLSVTGYLNSKKNNLRNFSGKFFTRRAS